jgi:hypothetical protein
MKYRLKQRSKTPTLDTYYTLLIWGETHIYIYIYIVGHHNISLIPYEWPGVYNGCVMWVNEYPFPLDFTACVILHPNP